MAAEMIDTTADTAPYRLIKALPHTVNGLRAMHIMALAARFNKPTGLSICTYRLPNPRGASDIPILVVRPKNVQRKLPVILHIHGGGYAVGTPYQDLAFMARIMRSVPCVFVAPFYRKSLHHPHPAALDDCRASLEWVSENFAQIGGRPDQIFTMGLSAGGGLVAALAQAARDEDLPKISGQIIIAGMLDDQSEALSDIEPKFVTWSRELNRLAWNKYLSLVDQAPPSLAVPARAASLAGLPPAVGYIGDHDLFLAQNVRYFERLSASGVDTTFEVLPGAYHGIESFAPLSVAGQKADNFIARNLNAWFAEGGA
ncbi:alpha/beta hydrolase [Rhodophyticola sp. CCM32]|uniref:alpha/beta hydrolase n=1 Tax=Rhodophyticola sp. CCM32 TaxID=2916397 RepID=UPI00107F2780|nr:alpha/beta hydrolase [Rhodophyticola sp. CCM32]QBY02559.1 alpha/beta hydrolase [Rhodophyticola sp. CCM32]